MEAFQPTELSDAVELRAQRPGAMVMAGGTDLMVSLNAGKHHPVALLDLGRIPQLTKIEISHSRASIGAMTTFDQLTRSEDVPLVLAAASRTVGSRQIRNRGTVGGNLATGSPAGDALPPLSVLDAQVKLRSLEAGVRSVPLDSFLVAPKHTALRPDELIIDIGWDSVDGPQVFMKIGPRNAMVIAVASLALLLDRRSRSCRIALGAVAPRVVRATAAEAALEEALGAASAWDDPMGKLDDVTVMEIAALAAQSSTPIDDGRGTASYRRHGVHVLAGRAIRRALEHLHPTSGGR